MNCVIGAVLAAKFDDIGGAMQRCSTLIKSLCGCKLAHTAQITHSLLLLFPACLIRRKIFAWIEGVLCTQPGGDLLELAIRLVLVAIVVRIDVDCGRVAPAARIARLLQKHLRRVHGVVELCRAIGR